MAQRPESMGKATKSQNWQDDAWRFYDEVGELRFGIGWLANGMSRVNLVAARQPEHQGDEPSAIEMPDDDDPEAAPLEPGEAAAVDLVSAIAGGSDGQGQLLAASCVQLSVPGVGYVLMEAEPVEGEVIVVGPEAEAEMPTPDETWTWRVLAQDELRAQGDTYEVACGPNTWRALYPDHILVRVWRPHPRRSWEADSPCRAVLGVLRQITLLDDHVQATATSRLAGAGVLILPTEAEFVPMPSAAPAQTVPADPPPLDEDDFVDTLVDTMTLPIGDRGTAAAVVPLVVRMPGELCDKPQHITFWSEFNAELLPLRNSAVQRLALGLDLPPEVLTGMAGMNHWGAWQVEETAITLHIEPMAETICHALTIGYLRPALEAAGVEAPDEYLVWYDTTDLTTRPDRSADAIALYDRIELSGAAARRESGLSEDDAPDDDERRVRLLLKALDNPTLAPTVLGELLPAAEGGGGAPTPPAAPVAPETQPEGPPEQPEGTSPPAETPPAEAASTAALLEACDGLVYRALERAGGRLRAAVGKRLTGGTAAVPCDDVALLHTQVKATEYASIDSLLAGAWERCGLVAARYSVDRDALVATLDSYTRALIATGHGHDSDRLGAALGLYAAV